MNPYQMMLQQLYDSKSNEIQFIIKKAKEARERAAKAKKDKEQEK